MNYLDTGFNARMEVLQGEINNHIKPLLDGHGWTWEIESTHKEGDGFLIIKIEKNSVIKRFGIIYGQTRYGLSQTLGITPYEAQDLINKYFQTYPKKTKIYKAINNS